MAPAPENWRLTRTCHSAAGLVRWDEFGDPAGEPVVLLHGTPFSSYVWRAVARALAPRHRVLVWDMPGYGQSEQRDGQDVSLAAQGRVFADLLGEFEQLPAALHQALVREYVTSASARPLPAGTLDALVAPWSGERGQPAFYRQIAQADQRYTDEIQPRYGQLALPVLVCWGTEDAWIPVAKAHELAAAVPGARLRLIDGAGQLVQEDAPAELTAAVVDSLR